MLRITRTTESGRVRLLLEGKLVGPWLEEFRDACSRETAEGQRLRLDLSTLTFVDGEGVKLLRELAGANHLISNCSPFVAELLQLERQS